MTLYNRKGEPYAEVAYWMTNDGERFTLSACNGQVLFRGRKDDISGFLTNPEMSDCKGLRMSMGRVLVGDRIYLNRHEALMQFSAVVETLNKPKNAPDWGNATPTLDDADYSAINGNLHLEGLLQSWEFAKVNAAKYAYNPFAKDEENAANEIPYRVWVAHQMGRYVALKTAIRYARQLAQERDVQEALEPLAGAR